MGHIARRRRYGNTPTEIDGIKFDSKLEARRWSELVLMQRANVISDLQRQVAYRLDVEGHHLCKFIVDFQYLEPGKGLKIEDTKSEITRKDPTYRLKFKLWRALYPGIRYEEILA